MRSSRSGGGGEEEEEEKKRGTQVEENVERGAKELLPRSVERVQSHLWRRRSVIARGEKEMEGERERERETSGAWFQLSIPIFVFIFPQLRIWRN